MDNSSVFGPSGQVFLYEWSKFRYGVFEEHGYPGDPLYPMFYKQEMFTPSGSKIVVKPNFCTNTEPTGSIENSNGEDCDAAEDMVPEDDCVFIVTGPEDLRSSVMGVPYFPGNEQWCDETEEKYHNADIPTKHNTMCDGQSVWSVIKRHSDFEEFTPMPDNDVDTTPVFNILQPSTDSQAFVFVLDYSNSMKNNGKRTKRLQQGIKRFINYDIYQKHGGKNLPFGVVSFSSLKDTKIEQPIIPITDGNASQKIVDAVFNAENHKYTCLHTGIQKGLETLDDYDIESGGSVIFLTDGAQWCEDGIKEWLDEVIQDVLDREIRFCTIAFGTEADSNLEKLAARTNGAAYFVPDGSSFDYVNNALSKCLDFLPSQPSTMQEVTLFQKSFGETFSSIEESFYVDKFIPDDWIWMTLDYNTTGEYKVTIQENSGSIMFNLTAGIDYMAFGFSTNTGYWNLTLEPYQGAKIHSLSMTVTSSPRSGLPSPDLRTPLQTHCWTSAGQSGLNLDDEDPELLIIYGQAMQGSKPVINAEIEAIITASTMSGEVKLRLRDDGVAPDIIKNDGVYSAYYIPRTESNQTRYSFVCKASGNDDTLIVDNNPNQGKSLPSRPSLSAPICCGSEAVKVFYIFFFINYGILFFSGRHSS